MCEAAVISASDRSSRGDREDIGGRLLVELAGTIPARVTTYRVVPDRIGSIRAALRSVLRRGTVKLVLTTGGTGVAPRDVTPEAVAPLIERDAPALSLAMRRTAWTKAPASVISRAVAGFNGDCLIVTVPGSPKAVRESFEVIAPAVKWLFSQQRKKEGDRP